MPVNKDALKRYRVIDRILSDPNHYYTTEDIFDRVNRNCDSGVSLRMIQKDIKALEEEFGKEMVRHSPYRGVVRYADQSTPVFYRDLTADEEAVLREVLKTLGQFEGLDSFTWLDLLKKRLEMSQPSDSRPLISFSVNRVLQIPATLLGRLFTAISRKKVIRIKYTVFGRSPKEVVLYPYQLRQYNDRWYLLGTPLEQDGMKYDPEFIGNFALDRIGEYFDYLDDVPYVDTKVDLTARFDEVVGVTLLEDEEVEDIYFAVRPASQNYVRTKWIHESQMEFFDDDLKLFREKYPSLSDCAFFSIECRPNYELYSRLASFGANLIVVEPQRIRERMRQMMQDASANYESIQE